MFIKYSNSKENVRKLVNYPNIKENVVIVMLSAQRKNVWNQMYSSTLNDKTAK